MRYQLEPKYRKMYKAMTFYHLQENLEINMEEN